MLRFSDTDEFMIREERGHTYGPISYERLENLIAKGVMDGTEKIAVYPDGDFVDLSTVPQFYDKLLVVLAESGSKVSEEEKHFELTQHQSSVIEEQDEHRERGIAIREDPETLKSLSSKKETSSLLDETKNPLTPQSYHDDTEVFYQDQYIKNKGKRRIFKFFLLIFLLLFLLILFYLDEQESSVHLLSPLKSNQVITVRYQKEQLDRAKRLFEMDTFSGYLQAQKIFVEVLGKKVKKDFFLENLSKNQKLFLQATNDKVYGPFSIDEVRKMMKTIEWDNIVAYSIDPKSQFTSLSVLPSTVDIYALLCLSHLELWPLSQQTADDLGTMNKVAHEAIKADPIGLAGQSCRFVRRKLGGRLEGLSGFVDSVLKDHPSAPHFYFYKAEMLEKEKNWKESLAHVQKAKELWPKWIKPYVLEARLRLRLDQVETAREILSVIVRNIPRHGEAKILLGEIEYRFLKKQKEGVKRIISGLSVDRSKREVFVRAHVLLAEYYRKSGRRKEALDSAKQVYRVDPLNLEMKNIIRQIGGEEELEKLKSDDKELIAQGILYQKKGDFLSAQAEFRKAYELNKKNIRAAILAGESSWELNQSADAIQWLKKAIAIDPQYIDAYLKLAEFYTEKYDFGRAVSNLRVAAKKTSGSSYKIYKSFAKLELKRRNYKGAIREAQKALKKYDSDVETFIIIAKAYYGKGDSQRAFEHAARAVHLDENNVKAQSTYAQMMAAFQSVPAASRYLERHISLRPEEMSYVKTLAKIYIQDDNPQMALKVLKPFLDIPPLQDKELWIMIGNIYKELQKPKRALRAYLSAAELDPSDAHPIFQIGKLYIDTQQPEKAIEHFNRVIKINSLYPMTHYYLGRAYINIGDASKALKEAKREKRYNPKLSSVYILAAEALMKMKRFSKASEELQKAIRLGRKTTKVYILLAHCYRELNSYDIALDMLKIAQNIEDGQAEVYREMGALYYAMGNKTAASAAYQKYLKLRPNASDRVQIESYIFK